MSQENENPDLLIPVLKDSEFKSWLVNYVGDKLKPENDEVNLEMVIQILAEEFPEVVLAVAEENFIRGYQQGLADANWTKEVSEQ